MYYQNIYFVFCGWEAMYNVILNTVPEAGSWWTKGSCLRGTTRLRYSIENNVICSKEVESH